MHCFYKVLWRMESQSTPDLMKLEILGLVLEGTCLFLCKETFCELTWVYCILWVSRKEDAAGTVLANTGALTHALQCQGTSGLKVRDLYLLCNCLKYLKLSLKFAVTSFMLTASVLPQGAGRAGASRPAFFLGDPVSSSRGPCVFPRRLCIFPRGCCWICPQPTSPTATDKQDPSRGRRARCLCWKAAAPKSICPMRKG